MDRDCNNCVYSTRDGDCRKWQCNNKGWTVEDIKAEAIDEFADFLRMSYDKGMRLSVAMCKNEIEKFKLKALYSRFIDAIDDCVKAFNEFEQAKEQKNDTI